MVIESQKQDFPLTIVCPKCGAALAERCPRCNAKAKVMGRLSDCLEWDRVLAGAQCPGVNRQSAVVCWCGKCRRYFERGIDGQRMGRYCEACAPKQQEFLTQMNADEVG